MELLMENREKVTDNYLFTLQFTVSKTGLILLSCCIDFTMSDKTIPQPVMSGF